MSVLKRTGAVVAAAATVKERSTGIGITFTDLNVCEILTVATDVCQLNNNLYFPESDLAYIADVQVGDKVSGANISDGSLVLKKDYIFKRNRIGRIGVIDVGSNSIRSIVCLLHCNCNLVSHSSSCSK